MEKKPYIRKEHLSKLGAIQLVQQRLMMDIRDLTFDPESTTNLFEEIEAIILTVKGK